MNATQKQDVLARQGRKCNICGATLKENGQISAHTFAKDRVRLEFDHRIPIDKGGANTVDNSQALCHYCNKCKRQMCFVCPLDRCSPECALVYPEKKSIVLATGENILDRLTRKHLDV